MKLKTSCIISICALASLACAGTIYHVALDGDNSNSGADWETAFATVEKALETAVYGDTVLVSDGVHIVSGAHLAVGGGLVVTNGVTLRSLNGPAATILARESKTFGVVTMYDDSLVSGFTISNGYGTGVYGGGAYLYGGVLSNCVATGNSARYGNGVYMEDGLVTHCEIVENSSAHSSGNGGGVMMIGGILENSLIAGNLSNGHGGGVHCMDGVIRDCIIATNISGGVSGGGVNLGGAAVLERCRIYGNEALGVGTASIYGGGGVFSTTGDTLIRNCLIYDNTTALAGGGINMHANGVVENCTIVGNYAGALATNTYGGGGLSFYCGSQVVTVRNSIVYYNESGDRHGGSNWHFRQGTSWGTINITNSCLGGGASTSAAYDLPPEQRGGGNYSFEPGFANRAGKDFSLASGSPCVNKAYTLPWMLEHGAIDLVGNARVLPAGGKADLGCFEQTPPGSIILIR